MLRGVIRPIATADLPSAVAVLAESIGPGWITSADLVPAPDRRVVVAEVDGGVAGVGTVSIRDWESSLPSDPDARAAVLALAGETPRTVGYLDAAAVAPAARGRGLYTAMLADRIGWAVGRRATLLMSVGWTPPDGCRIAGAMWRAGFAELARITGFYAGDRIPAGASCIHCGRPCGCDAILFARLA